MGHYPDLSDAKMAGATLEGAIFRHRTTLRNVDLSELNCGHADFSQATLDSAKFHRTNLEDASFRDCSLRGSDFFQTRFGPKSSWWTRRRNRGLTHCSLAAADLTNAKFVESDLAWVDFDNCVVSDTRFENVTLPAKLPTRLRLTKDGKQVLTDSLAASFFTRPVIEAEIPLHSDRVVRKVMDDWVASRYRQKIEHGIVLVGAEAQQDVVRLQFQGKSYRDLYSLREKVCAHFKPLEREDWAVWSACLTPKQRLEAIAAMMQDERSTPERMKQLEMLLALELPKSVTIQGDAPPSPVVHHHYHISDGGKVIVGDDHSQSTAVRNSVLDGSAVGQRSRTEFDRK